METEKKEETQEEKSASAPETPQEKLAEKDGALAPLHPSLEKAHSYFRQGNYRASRKEIAEVLKANTDDAELKKAADDLYGRMKVEPGAIIAAAAVFVFLIVIVYLGILSR